MTKLKLADIKTPVVEVTLLDNTDRTFDPFEMLPRLEPILAELEDSNQAAASLNKLRQALGLTPKQANDFHCVTIVRSMVELIQELQTAKKE